MRYYNPGVPCLKGHTAGRYVSNNVCITCAAEYRDGAPSPRPNQPAPAIRVISRADAKLIGEPRYFTGVPCTRGHVAERYTCNTICIACSYEYRVGAPRTPKVVSQEPPRIISRADARALGLARYFTGMPCRRGHTAERYASVGICVKCAEELRKGTERSPRVHTTPFAAPAGLNRWQAGGAGFKRYTGEPCEHCKAAVRFVANNACVVCK